MSMNRGSRKRGNTILPGAAVYTWFAGSLIQGVEGAGRQALVNVSIAGVLLMPLSFIPTLAHRFARRRRGSAG